MKREVVRLESNLRVWQDERFGQAWRVAYREGDDETIVTLADTAALGDFIAEQLGLTLVDMPLARDLGSRLAA